VKQDEFEHDKAKDHDEGKHHSEDVADHHVSADSPLLGLMCAVFEDSFDVVHIKLHSDGLAHAASIKCKCLRLQGCN
jgi:hypothetical protein